MAGVNKFVGSLFLYGRMKTENTGVFYALFVTLYRYCIAIYAPKKTLAEMTINRSKHSLRTKMKMKPSTKM